MPTYRLDLAYDGTDFHGYARQPEVRTVQEVLEESLFRLAGPVETSVAGRTDAGVHAAGQVVSFSTSDAVDTTRLVRALRRMLPDDLAVLSCSQAAEDFNARFSAKSRTYRYMILNRPTGDPLLRRSTWHVSENLAVDRMNEAVRQLTGEHDFASFCRKGRPTVREVLAAEWEHQGGSLLRFEVTAKSFCHQMVRSIVAFCVEVGRGRIPAERTPQVLAARDRNAARGAAPARGLVLWKVGY